MFSMTYVGLVDDSQPDPSMVPGVCKDIYTNITSMQGGQILWAYLKPLMLGQVLYTPDNAVTSAIIGRANSTFSTLTTLLDTMASIVESRDSIFRSLNGTEGVVRLQVRQPQLLER